jgi:2-amino-4-hydroxy-6-hydroxymethyldihydropteridine diphosphokinase
VTKQDISENQVKTVFLGIGSNLGNRNRNIELSKFKLHLENIKIIKCSSNYETPSWPNPKKPKFINIVLKIKTYLSPQKLLELCKKIERELGRKKRKKNDPRECDIDIIDYSGLILNKDIVLPHTLMHQRNFVLIPLHEIQKDWKHPKLKRNIKDLISQLPNKDIRSIKQI